MNTLANRFLSSTAVHSPETGTGSNDAEQAKLTAILNRKALAKTYADALGEEIFEEINVTLDADETRKRNSLVIMFQMMDRLDGQDGRPSIGDAPVPGSKDGNNPDQYSDTQKNAKGEKVAVRSSFWKDVALSTPEGARIMLALQEVNGKTGKWDTSKDDTAITEWRRTAEKKKLDSRKAGLVTLVRKSAALYFQFVAMKELAPKVMFQVEKDNEGSDSEDIANVTSPITVYNPEKAGQFESFGVTQFLQLDVAEARKNGGTYGALIKTLGREPGNGQGDTGTKVKRIKNMDDLLSVLDEVYEFLNTETDDGQKHAAQLAKLMANPKAGDDVVMTIGNAADVLDAPSTRIRDRWAELQHSRTAQRNKDKDTKAA